MPAAFSETAFISPLRPTTSGTIACEAGIISANTTPCSSDATNRCSKRSCPEATSSPIAIAITADPAWPICSSRFFAIRSASTPPTTDSESIGIALASPISPSAENESVSSNAR